MFSKDKIKLKSENGTKKHIVREYTEAIFTAVVLALLLRTFVIQAFKIPSESMMDTLLVGDYLLVNKFIYGTKIPFTDKYLWKWHEPERGDVIVFKYPRDKSRDFIKRCIAVAGDTVMVRNNVVYINGQEIYEDYKTIRGPSSPLANWGPKVVPEGFVLPMGDNRNNSSDGREWGFLDKNLIRGKALILYFSWDSHEHLPRFNRIGSPIY